MFVWPKATILIFWVAPPEPVGQLECLQDNKHVSY